MKPRLILIGLFLATIAGFSQTPVKWYTIEEALELNKKEPRKILIDVYTEWCGWCKVMDRNTYSNQIIADYLNKNFYPVKFDAEQKTDVIFNGVTYKYTPNGSKGFNELAVQLLSGNMGFPSTVFLDEKSNMIQPIQGYIQPKQFDAIIKFIGENQYKTVTWDKFQSTYTSPIN